jgi:hypothetical protein
MQLIPRYLVKNRITILANEAGFITEYKPVYQRHINVYRGIDNVLDFKVLNADQKPIDITNYTPKFQAFDENKLLVAEYDGEVIPGDDSAPTRGLFKVTFAANDLLNINQQYLSYNIHLVDNTSAVPTLTYSNSHFGMNGTILISAEAFPGPAATYSVTDVDFLEDNSIWNSSVLTAQPDINGNEALHTAVVYSGGYVGGVSVQATLDDQINNGTNWTTVASLTFDGAETEPTPVNFNGVFSFLRFQTSNDPTGIITKILVRN